MGRIDHYDDPAAPRPNSLVPSANVLVTNDQGQVLLIRRSDNGNWALPGGGMDLGESIVACGVRETLEETGVTCQVTGLLGIFTDPKHLIEYTSNGEVRQEFSVVFTAAYISGRPTPSSESSQVRWVDPDQLADLRMDRSMRMRVDLWLQGADMPHLG
ncbi:NUDIX domain-containing protein [Kineosporia rhizophila]|uniref:NUDIX hydrolase n=1 Tax=Kineosporia TaxID=49184 RepID=UPI000B0A876C|nr:NUDIX domain-containing protein [Kineosporia sp. NBRC 101677]MCE0540302.1 NUDIX domain-containing protein [Kineosporia rhizophila]GLY16331.1 putative MutT/NUDIX-like protein [Kineosporia sp. NBRC 101677]